MSQSTDTPTSALYQHAIYPDRRGRYGDFGGRFVPESLMAALDELEREFERARQDDAFLAELRLQERTYSGRPTPLYFAQRLSQRVGARGSAAAVAADSDPEKLISLMSFTQPPSRYRMRKR